MRWRLVDLAQWILIRPHKGSGVDIPEADYPKLFTMKDVVSYLGRGSGY